MTKVDKICELVHKDLKDIYYSKKIKEKVISVCVSIWFYHKRKFSTCDLSTLWQVPTRLVTKVKIMIYVART